MRETIGFVQESDRLVVYVPYQRYQEFLELAADNNAYGIEVGAFYGSIVFHLLTGKTLVNYIEKLNNRCYDPNYRSKLPPLDISMDSQQRFCELLPKLVRKEQRQSERKAIGFNF